MRRGNYTQSQHMKKLNNEGTNEPVLTITNCELFFFPSGEKTRPWPPSTSNPVRLHVVAVSVRGAAAK